MPKSTKTENAAAEAVALTENNQGTDLATTNSEVLDLDGIFSTAQGEPWRDLSTEYKTFESGESLDIVKTGQSIRDLAGDGSENKVIEAMDRAGNSYIFGDAVIVSSLWDKPAPAVYRILCTGAKKGQRGTYKTFKILTW